MKIKNLALATAAFASIAAVADVYQVKFTVATVTNGKKANVTVNGAYDSSANKYAFWTKNNYALGTVEFDVANNVTYRRSLAQNAQLAWGKDNVLVAAGFGSAKSLSGKVAGILGGAPAAGTWTMKKTNRAFSAIAKADVNEKGITALPPNLVLGSVADDALKAAADAIEAQKKAEAAQADAEAAQKKAEAAQADAEDAKATAEKLAAEKGAEAEVAKQAQADAEAKQKKAEDDLVAAEGAKQVAEDAQKAAEEVYAELIGALQNVETIEDMMTLVEKRVKKYEKTLAEHTAWLETHEDPEVIVDKTNETWTVDVPAALAAINTASNDLAKILRPAQTYDVDQQWYQGAVTDPEAIPMGDTVALTVIPAVVTAQEALEAAKLALQEAEDELQQAKDDLPALIEAKKEEVKKAENQVKNAQKALDEANAAVAEAEEALEEHLKTKPDGYVVKPDVTDEDADNEWTVWAKTYSELLQNVRDAKAEAAAAEKKLEKKQANLKKLQDELAALEKGDFSELEKKVADAKDAVEAAQKAYDEAKAYYRDNDDTNQTVAAKKALDAAVQALVELGDKLVTLENNLAVYLDDPDAYLKEREEIIKEKATVTESLEKIQAIKDQLEKAKGDADADAE